ncbi:tRNA threonylcarbamoyladenosine biosynthesis protein TsaE [Tumidithrix helvetica PCC 7403]|uniref:tRNA (adenosine(37)-N6)-threonylcarbamoyltransferase complex ATPase subunit type 1 TsaE n=1 Tax=Tumidithrix helvetica TaxID=3457545 RepID=UPI003CC14B05
MTKPSDRLNQSITIQIDRLATTQAIAQQLANLLQRGTILLLEGNLGSGKTTFVQALGKGLGIQIPITSPTFTLIDEYDCGRIPLYHIDLYRLEGEQIYHLHLQEYWRGHDFPLGVVAIEWSNRLPQLPEHYIKIELAIAPEICAQDPLKDNATSASLKDAAPSIGVDLEEIELDPQSDRQITFTICGSQYETIQQFVNSLPTPHPLSKRQT